MLVTLRFEGVMSTIQSNGKGNGDLQRHSSQENKCKSVHKSFDLSMTVKYWR